ncbi:hypothetical protein [Sphingobium sp.]|uniref:hypothetical protein n=1 Tax=Sphingobium sp. TaxID=1912891 RepID=UPI0035C6935F
MLASTLTMGKNLEKPSRPRKLRGVTETSWPDRKRSAVLEIEEVETSSISHGAEEAGMVPAYQAFA